MKGSGTHTGKGCMQATIEGKAMGMSDKGDARGRAAHSPCRAMLALPAPHPCSPPADALHHQLGRWLAPHYPVGCCFAGIHPPVECRGLRCWKREGGCLSRCGQSTGAGGPVRSAEEGMGGGRPVKGNG